MSKASSHLPAPAGGDFLLYQTEDGRTRIEVRFHGETVWLTQAQMAELFQTTIPNVSIHLRNIFKEGELRADSVVKEFLTTATDGKNYQTRFYNLDVIISVGYRVKSHRGTQFRIWATQRLREYIIKGFTLDDERLKRAGGGNYFDELLARIRDIRSSEKVFWRKVLEIYATSIDYDPGAEASQQFFATVQNKMHWAVHGQTAAEVIARRADAAKPNMGLTSWTGSRPRKEDVAVAKNYLAAGELDALNRIVTAYLEFAELQARNRKAMYMQDWIAKLDEFLRLSEHDILTNVGKVSHAAALVKAEAEYEKFRVLEAGQPSPVEQHFQQAIEQVKQLEASKAPKRKKTMSDPQILKDLKPTKEFFIGIDSDGCVFDTMELKHKECFAPMFIKHFRLQTASKYAREVWDFVNLYSKTRGVNRFPAVVRALNLLRERKEVIARKVAMPDTRALEAWIARETKLGNAVLKQEIEAGNHSLAPALAWSLAVNKAVEDMVSGVPPFPFFCESLEKMVQQADVIVVSQTPTEALVREWKEHGIDRFVRAMAGQELGTKAEHIQFAAGGKYPAGKILMIGDAPGDLKAARSNHALFYPIIPGHEEASWERFFKEGLDRFFAGTYAGAYEAGLIREFDASLPERPPWQAS